MNTLRNVYDEVNGWVSAPFIGQVSMQQLFLATGLVLVALVVWAFIFRYIRATAETI
jgi:hypothetical protein